MVKYKLAQKSWEGSLSKEGSPFTIAQKLNMSKINLKINV